MTLNHDLFTKKVSSFCLLKNLSERLTGEFLLDTLILASTNTQYDKKWFIELQVQCMKIPSLEHVVYINCSECQNKNKKTICVHNMF